MGINRDKLQIDILAFISGLILLIYASWPAQAEEKIPDAHAKAIYVSMHPHFIVNLADSKLAFVQLKAQVLVGDEATQQAMMLHMPAIRHDMIIMLSTLRTRDLQSSEQKEALRQNALDIIRAVLEKYKQPNNVKGFFITSIIIQQ